MCWCMCNATFEYSTEKNPNLKKKRDKKEKSSKNGKIVE